MRSGLVFGLDPRRGLNASLSLPAGEGDLLEDFSSGACRFVASVGVEAFEGAVGKVEDLSTLFCSVSVVATSGKVDACTRGDEVVK